MDLSFWAATNVGRKRTHNEDNYLVDQKLSLFIVADGMGGHASGEIASQIAVAEIRSAIDSRRDILEAFGRHETGVTTHDVLGVLEYAVQAAGLAIYERGQKEPDKRGMGTTASLFLLIGERGFIAHVGDSRIYMVRDGRAEQLTEDHSLINELIRHGKVTRETLAKSPYASYKNAVTRAVGVYETVQVDTMDLEVLPGDQFLLCSDGLHTYLDDKEIARQLAEENTTAIPDRLVEIANKGGGHDNITALVMRVHKEATPTADARTQELNRKVEVLKQMPLFRHLTYKEILRVLALTEVKDFKPADEIITEDEPGSELFIILSGKVRLHKEGALVTHVGQGAHLGEMALIDNGPRSVSATAEEPTRMLVLRRRDFNDLIRNFPRLSVKLLWSFVQVLGQRLRKTNEDLAGARNEAAEPITPVPFDE
ncbi:MAG: Stp1/IreP family PP2C-type Ser/Thr phosphatase [Deltaproteobacteria bacterium]|jgi:serine/threonine protein phosphatase PrpC|nr:Stp1/IreP family PP2C-type Ser/Thr phosphatase [Deltaproteobacteria bacterium]